MRLFTLAAVFLGMPGLVLAQFSQPPVAELKRVLQEQEKALVDAQFAVDSARARLAKAEGKLDVAAVEGRKVLAYHEAQYKALMAELARGRICYVDPTELEGMIAVDRAWLAEVEGKADVSLVELPKAIAYYEGRIRYVENLQRRAAIGEKEATSLFKEYGGELGLVKVRLAVLKARK